MNLDVKLSNLSIGEQIAAPKGTAGSQDSCSPFESLPDEILALILEPAMFLEVDDHASDELVEIRCAVAVHDSKFVANSLSRTNKRLRAATIHLVFREIALEPTAASIRKLICIIRKGYATYITGVHFSLKIYQDFFCPISSWASCIRETKNFESQWAFYKFAPKHLEMLKARCATLLEVHEKILHHGDENEMAAAIHVISHFSNTVLSMYAAIIYRNRSRFANVRQVSCTNDLRNHSSILPALLHAFGSIERINCDFMNVFGRVTTNISPNLNQVSLTFVSTAEQVKQRISNANTLEELADFVNKLYPTLKDLEMFHVECSDEEEKVLIKSDEVVEWPLLNRLALCVEATPAEVPLTTREDVERYRPMLLCKKMHCENLRLLEVSHSAHLNSISVGAFCWQLRLTRWTNISSATQFIRSTPSITDVRLQFHLYQNASDLADLFKGLQNTRVTRLSLDFVYRADKDESYQHPCALLMIYRDQDCIPLSSTIEHIVFRDNRPSLYRPWRYNDEWLPKLFPKLKSWNHKPLLETFYEMEGDLNAIQAASTNWKFELDMDELHTDRLDDILEAEEEEREIEAEGELDDEEEEEEDEEEEEYMGGEALDDDDCFCQECMLNRGMHLFLDAMLAAREAESDAESESSIPSVD